MDITAIEDTLAYSCPPMLPEDDIIDAILDAGRDRRAIRNILDEHGVIDHTHAHREGLARLLRFLADVRIIPRRPGRTRAVAYCCLMLVNRCPISEPEVARRCGVSKSDISRWKRELEERWGVESAGVRRSPESRRKFKELATRNEALKRLQRARILSEWQTLWKSL